MSKLYTEEQVKKLTTAAYYAGKNHNAFIFSNEFENLTPIELPSDEELEERAEKNINPFSFMDGAKWMRDKIKGGNNE